MQMQCKLNSLLEATRGSDKKDTSHLTIRCVQKLFLERETRPRTEAFKSHYVTSYFSLEARQRKMSPFVNVEETNNRK